MHAVIFIQIISGNKVGLNKVGLNYETFRNSKILLHCIPQQVDILSAFAYGSNFEDKFIVQ